jgi:hypothetical protein
MTSADSQVQSEPATKKAKTGLSALTDEENDYINAEIRKYCKDESRTLGDLLKQDQIMIAMRITDSAKVTSITLTEAHVKSRVKSLRSKDAKDADAS